MSRIALTRIGYVPIGGTGYTRGSRIRAFIAFKITYTCAFKINFIICIIAITVIS